MNNTTDGSSNKLVPPLCIAKRSFVFFPVLGLPSLLIKQHNELFAQMWRTLWIKSFHLLLGRTLCNIS